MKKIAVVTGSDKKYFPYLKSLILSLKNSGALNVVDLCILDAENNSEYFGYQNIVFFTFIIRIKPFI